MIHKKTELPSFDFGVVSLTVGALAIFLYGSLTVYIIAIGESMSQTTELSLNNVLAMGLLCLAGVLNLLGIALGLVGLFQTKRSKLIPISGLTLNSLVITPCCLLLLLGMLTSI
jgi:hypothetical protein